MPVEYAIQEVVIYVSPFFYNYNVLTTNLSSFLETIETKLDIKLKQKNVSNRDKRPVLSSLHKSEVEENKLRTSLERTR